MQLNKDFTGRDLCVRRLAILAVDVVTAIFWFAGFIALAVFIGVPDCGNNHICGSLQASVAFGAFLW